jgi:hypothetical protein
MPEYQLDRPSSDNGSAVSLIESLRTSITMLHGRDALGSLDKKSHINAFVEPRARGGNVSALYRSRVGSNKLLANSFTR